MKINLCKYLLCLNNNDNMIYSLQMQFVKIFCCEQCLNMNQRIHSHVKLNESITLHIEHLITSPFTDVHNEIQVYACFSVCDCRLPDPTSFVSRY